MINEVIFGNELLPKRIRCGANHTAWFEEHTFEVGPFVLADFPHPDKTASIYQLVPAATAVSQTLCPSQDSMLDFEDVVSPVAEHWACFVEHSRLLVALEVVYYPAWL